MDNTIEVENLKKIYKKNFKKIHALKNVSFKVRKGQILGILGPNGAGKTTLLKIITGIISPEKNSGKVILFENEDLKSVKNRMGFLPENPEFFRNISAWELLEFSLKLSGKAFDKESISQLLKEVNLYAERSDRIRSFSKGMRQRIGVAQAIIHSPDLLILDEPMSGLDPPGRRMVIDIIKNFSQQGKTILFSTHNLDDIEALCTDVLVLNKGEIQLEKKLTELRKHCTYKIEVENRNQRILHHAKNQIELWELLNDAKDKGHQIIRVQSGIADQLEQYYKEENSDEKS